MSSLRIRRAIVFLAAIAALYGGALAIRSAAGWSGQSAPLAEAPPDPAVLVGQLVDERARAQQLAGQLDEATARSAELEAALAAATAKAGHDARAADRLVRQLEAARAKLADLQDQLAATPAQAMTVSVPATPTAGSLPPAESEAVHEVEGSD